MTGNNQSKKLFYESLPRLEINPSPLSNNLHLHDLDIDCELPPNVNLNYYCSEDFRENHEISNSTHSQPLSFFHQNIRSLSKNYDNLVGLLSELSYPFSIIGLTEIKITDDTGNLDNTEISGYKFIHQPTLSNAGGAGVYLHESLINHYTKRIDLTTSKADLFESLWIELHNKSRKNILFAVVYRHPRERTDEFMEYINKCLDTVQREQKPCIMMGDFNLDLLKHESREPINEFLNTMYSSYFLPHLLLLSFYKINLQLKSLLHSSN